MNLNPQHIDVLDLIPQRPPVVMITAVHEVDKNIFTTCFKIVKENIFCNNGFLDEEGLIENIAQTAAAMNGYVAMINNQAILLGYIGAIKDLKVFSLPRVNTEIITSVEVQNKVMNVSIIKGIIRQGEEMIATCEMKIFIDETK